VGGGGASALSRGRPILDLSASRHPGSRCILLRPQPDAGPGQGAVVIGNGQRTVINGTLADSYVDPNQGIQIAMNEINFLLEGVAPSLRGKIAGQEGKAQVTCTNTTTGQSVLKKSKGKYDCVKSGLTVRSGDGFSISITGTVD
jgi:hypothetical protein